MAPLENTTETTETETLSQFKFYLKGSKSMRYVILKSTAPATPNLENGTDCIKLLLLQASKDMFGPLIPMFSPFLTHT